MNWMDWVVVGWLLIGVVATVAMVGRPRDPILPGVAAWIVLINVALILGMVLV